MASVALIVTASATLSWLEVHHRWGFSGQAEVLNESLGLVVIFTWCSPWAHLCAFILFHGLSVSALTYM